MRRPLQLTRVLSAALLTTCLFGCNEMLGIREGSLRRSEDPGCAGECDAGLVIPEGCGNGELGPSEVCDGDCPTTCDDGIACTSDTMLGDPRSCDARCVAAAIEACVSGDGCCPAGCDHAGDDDCSTTCGDGAIDVLESCDGNCPTACDDGASCTIDLLTGSADNCSATCSFVAISECVTGDGCCPAGCVPEADGDCSSSCGNGVAEPPETCDGDCPLLCLDGNFCTIDRRLGSPWTCSSVCTHTEIVTCQHDDGCCPQGCNALADDDCPAVCGNDLVEPGETCDGDCPTGCADADACTSDVLFGNPGTCTAACPHTRLTSCIGGDGCCPDTCDFHVDSDCPAVFAKRKELVVDAGLVQAPGGGVLTSFPVLVSFYDADLARSARVDGRDIFFAASDGVALLDFEIDTYNAGTLIAWVRIPVLSSTTSTPFYLYYGDGRAWDRADANDVWDASYAGVWHLGNDPGPGGVGEIRDASGAGRHGTAPAAATSSDLVVGQVGRALSLSSEKGAFDFGDAPSLDGVAQLTVSAWVRFDALTSGAAIVRKGDDAADVWSMGLAPSPVDALVVARVGGSSGGPDASTSTGFVTTGSLHQWTMVFDGTQPDEANRLAFYLDGARQDLTVRGAVPSRLPATSAPLRLGGSSDVMVDELVIATVARPREWIATHFANVASPSAFVTRGSEEGL